MDLEVSEGAVVLEGYQLEVVDMAGETDNYMNVVVGTTDT